MVCREAMADYDGPVLVVAGDMPLIRDETVTALLQTHKEGAEGSEGRGVTVASSVFHDPTGYGRIDRDDEGNLLGIVEHLDCTEEQRDNCEVNISYYCYDSRLLFESLNEVKPDNVKGELYITDTVKIMLDRGQGAEAEAIVPQEDAVGVNSREDLAMVGGIMQDRIQRGWMDGGVTIVDPGSTWIEAGCSIGRDAVIEPFCVLKRGCEVGEGVVIGSMTVLESAGRV